jgi:lipid-binding SYLF domain-containing protein
MNTHSWKSRVPTLIAALAIVATPLAARAKEPSRQELITAADDTITTTFKAADPSMAKLFTDTAGYVVFPEVKKGAFIAGGAGGMGVLYEKGKPVGMVKLSQITVGAQVGGQAYSEIVFLQTPAAVATLKENKIELSAQASAVAAKSGAAANARFDKGVAIFTAAKGGLMVEASVGGQKFKYAPFSGTPAS